MTHSKGKQPDSAAVFKKDADWYDEHYRTLQTGLSPWYRFLLPELDRTLQPHDKLVELGCGQAHALRVLAQKGILPPGNIWGVDQSKVAVEFCRQRMPGAHFVVGDLYALDCLESNHFDACLLMETIEHLREPERAIAHILRILKPGGKLYVSFPNYLHLPWLLVRILAEKLHRPNWIVLQPVDKIYTVYGIIRLLQLGGFSFQKGIGTNYGPPVIYITKTLNSLGLWRLSFHPILIFTKPAG
jgi:ubiquinone/menaquinone biosynthesis C-methylase UbiE